MYDSIYLSGPMTGLPENNYPAFHAAAHNLRARGFEVLNPAAQPEKPSWQEYMRWDLRALLEHCYGLVYLPGWEVSPGALTEIYIANALRMPTVSIDDDLGLVRLLRERGHARSSHQITYVHTPQEENPSWQH